MIAVREFKTADEQIEFYKALKARRQYAPVARPVLVKPVEPEPAPGIPAIAFKPVVAPAPCPDERGRKIYFWPIGPTRKTLVSSLWILTDVCKKYGVTLHELRGPCRFQEYVLPRHEAAYRLRTELKISFPQIGRLLGGRDHTTALNGFRRFSERIAKGMVK